MSDTSTRISIPRSRRRIPVAFEVADGPRGAGRIARISQQGFFVCTEALPKPGKLVRVIIHDSEARTNIEVTGSVRWNTEQLDSTRSGFGVQVVTMPRGFAELFERIMTR